MTFRLVRLVAGLALWGVATALMIRSELGLGPWDAFHVGLHLQTGITVGTASMVAGLGILLLTLAMRVRPGVATILNMVLLGVFIDLLLPVIPVASSPWLAVPYFAAGIVLAGVATGLYINAGLGQGPRDALMIAIHERTGWSVGRARAALELVVLAAGWAMGGRVGVGTVIFAAAIGPVVQWGLRTFPPTLPPEGDVIPLERPARKLRRAA